MASRVEGEKLRDNLFDVAARAERAILARDDDGLDRVVML
jgi:hypothetical protein